jgi:hypothetical protein
MSKTLRRLAVLSALVAIAACAQSSTRGGPAPWATDFDVDPANLASVGRNPYFILEPGYYIVLKDHDKNQVTISVLDETRVVAGVETRVVEEHEESDGRVIEVSRNFFAQNANGDVCYFGEEVDMYADDGSIAAHTGSWRADGRGVRPGMFMPADPRVGQAFRQEMAPGVAEDQSKVVALGERTEVPAGTFEDTVTMTDLNPLDGTEDAKVYARGIGLIVDESAELTTYSPRD